MAFLHIPLGCVGFPLHIIQEHNDVTKGLLCCVEFFPNTFFVLSAWALYLAALSAWICSLATIIRSLTVVHLELLWLGLEYSKFCVSSNTPQCVSIILVTLCLIPILYHHPMV